MPSVVLVWKWLSTSASNVLPEKYHPLPGGVGLEVVEFTGEQVRRTGYIAIMAVYCGHGFCRGSVVLECAHF